MQSAESAGDSGWRQLPATGFGASAGSTFLIRRIGHQVLVNLRGVTVSETSRTIANVLSLPEGFRAASDYVFLVDSNPSSVGREILVNIFNGSATYARETAGSASEQTNVKLDGIIEFTTFSAWPQNLPGTPA